MNTRGMKTTTVTYQYNFDTDYVFGKTFPSSTLKMHLVKHFPTSEPTNSKEYTEMHRYGLSM